MHLFHLVFALSPHLKLLFQLLDFPARKSMIRLISPMGDTKYQVASYGYSSVKIKLMTQTPNTFPLRQVPLAVRLASCLSVGDLLGTQVPAP